MIAAKFKISAFISVAIFTNSVLHTWYVAETNQYTELDFGLPFSERIRISRAISDGYIGSFFLAENIFLISYFSIHWLFPLREWPISLFLEQKMILLLEVSLVIIILSQCLGGCSWSKFALDLVVLLVAFLIYISYLRPIPFWQIFATYIGIITLLGYTWGKWMDYFVEEKLVNEGNHGGIYPHFPSFAYFVGSSIVIIFGSLTIIIQNIS